MASTALEVVSEEKVLFEGRPQAMQSVARWFWALLSLGVMAVVYWVKARSLRVRITSERVTIKKGLLSLTTDTVELYRVVDIKVTEPFLERMVGCGRLVLTCTDRSDATLELQGLKNVEPLANQIRQAVEAQKLRRQVHTHAEA